MTQSPVATPDPNLGIGKASWRRYVGGLRLGLLRVTWPLAVLNVTPQQAIVWSPFGRLTYQRVQVARVRVVAGWLGGAVVCFDREFTDNSLDGFMAMDPAKVIYGLRELGWPTTS